MKTDGNRDSHASMRELFTTGCAAPMCEAEDPARLHFSCTCLCSLLTQMYCKEMATLIGVHVHVKVAPGGKPFLKHKDRKDKHLFICHAFLINHSKVSFQTDLGRTPWFKCSPLCWWRIKVLQRFVIKHTRRIPGSYREAAASGRFIRWSVFDKASGAAPISKSFHLDVWESATPVLSTLSINQLQPYWPNTSAATDK